MDLYTKRYLGLKHPDTQNQVVQERVECGVQLT